jgi:hypothetical protein
MATDIIARGMAANAKKSVTELGNKVESEKWIGTKAEWEAVDKSTIKDGTIVYITDDKTVILYDKAEMEKIAAQVATDRKAAETAAQTAQAVADSLPEDYVTAVGKIAENTADIANVKLTDKELKRRVDALFDIGQGVTHQFETDSETAYAKTVPTGAKLMSVKSIGGHSEVIDGEIVSAGTESVVEQGKNLWDKSGKENSDAYTIPMYYNGRYKGLKIPCENGDYVVSTKHKSGYTSGMSKAVYVIATEISTDNNLTGTVIEHSTGYGYNVDKTGTISVKHGYIILSVYFGDSTAASRKSFFDLCDIQIEKSSTATAYAPYHRNEYPIPEAIKALPGYGWSAGTAKNYVDYENKQYHQCVGSVDLGTLNWGAVSGYDNSFRTVPPRKKGGYNMICTKYNVSNNSLTSIPDKSMTSNAGDGNTYVKDTAYTDATAFKQAMQGVMLYYELESPIVTDISTLIDDDFLRNIEVEAGGTITFKNSNDNYHIPVPSEEEYIVKLSEVGGTT